MATSKSYKLDLVSRVTIYVFVGQLVLAAILASVSPTGFTSTFVRLLMFYAIVQTLLGFGAKKRAPATSLNERDGVLWLLLVATGCLLVGG